MRNVSAPKAKPQSQTAPRMLKLSLTDGHTNCQAIEMKPIPALSLDNTAPGTKLYINGAQILSGCLMLDLKCCKVLGGNVSALVERWEVSKLMPSHVRGRFFQLLNIIIYMYSCISKLYIHNFCIDSKKKIYLYKYLSLVIIVLLRTEH